MAKVANACTRDFPSCATSASQTVRFWPRLSTPAVTIDSLAEPVGEEWVVPVDFVDAVLGAGLGEDVSRDERSFWHSVYQQHYRGDDGRHRLRVCAINLRDRDGLHARLDSVRCPVLWLQGTADTVYSVANAEAEFALFTGSAGAELRVVDGGQHFMSASHPDIVNAAAVEFIRRWS